MKEKIIFLLVTALLISGCSKDQSIEDKIITASNSPVFNVKDTEYKYGRYDEKTKKVTLRDLIKFHGHLCGGLVETAVMARVAFNKLFPETNGIIDRTDIKIISNNSACGGDVLEYLSGARFRFNSHCIDKTLTGDSIIIHRISTGRTIQVSLNKKYFPSQVRKTMKKINSGKFTSADIDSFGSLQQNFALRLVTTPFTKTVNAQFIDNFTCKKSQLSEKVRRRDNDYKNHK